MKEVQGESRDVGECFSPLLECSSRFLGALQQNRARPRLLYYFVISFVIKNPLNSQRISFHYLIFKTNYWQMACQLQGRVLYSHKARLLNQSVCALYLNSIIKRKKSKVKEPRRPYSEQSGEVPSGNFALLGFSFSSQFVFHVSVCTCCTLLNYLFYTYCRNRFKALVALCKKVLRFI